MLCYWDKSWIAFCDGTGNDLELEAEIHFPDGKKSSGNKITGIQVFALEALPSYNQLSLNHDLFVVNILSHLILQFSKEESHKIMITSEDSKLRILDGFEVIHKFKGKDSIDKTLKCFYFE